MRRWLLVLLPVLSLLVAPLASARRFIPQAAALRVHEWGVWKLRHGEVAHLADLQRESPAFVLHTRPPGPVGGGMISRKPVVYVYTDRPTELDVEVGFRGGGPWLYYPAAQPFECGVGAVPFRGPVVERDFVARRRAAPFCQPTRLHWRVRAVPARVRVPLQPVAAGHFWNWLRSVPASAVLAPDGSAERFLFYDGPVAFPTAYRTSAGPAGSTLWTHVGPGGRTPPIVAWGSRWVPLPALQVGAGVGMDRTQPWPPAPHSLAEELGQRLRAAGLSVDEARALIETWRPEIDAPGLRAFWLLTRDEYDELLPMRITPAPTELVRVGLVIEQIDP